MGTIYVKKVETFDVQGLIDFCMSSMSSSKLCTSTYSRTFVHTFLWAQCGSACQAHCHTSPAARSYTLCVDSLNSSSSARSYSADEAPGRTVDAAQCDRRDVGRWRISHGALCDNAVAAQSGTLVSAQHGSVDVAQQHTAREERSHSAGVVRWCNVVEAQGGIAFPVRYDIFVWARYGTLRHKQAHTFCVAHFCTLVAVHSCTSPCRQCYIVACKQCDTLSSARCDTSAPAHFCSSCLAQTCTLCGVLSLVQSGTSSVAQIGIFARWLGSNSSSALSCTLVFRNSLHRRALVLYGSHHLIYDEAHEVQDVRTLHRLGLSSLSLCLASTS